LKSGAAIKKITTLTETQKVKLAGNSTTATTAKKDIEET
jgi:hypothetical protein